MREGRGRGAYDTTGVKNPGAPPPPPLLAADKHDHQSPSALHYFNLDCLCVNSTVEIATTARLYLETYQLLS